MATTATRSPKAREKRRAALLAVPGVRQFQRRAGGRRRAGVVALLAGVLALESADIGTIGAVARQIQGAYGVNHAQLGLLASASLLVSALATLPFGALVDRSSRVRLLTLSVALWGVAMIAVGSAPSFTLMFVARLALGLVMAAAGPALASLVGDYFDPRERGRIYGLIGVGELLGTAFGFMVSGSVAAVVGWRFAFYVLALPAFALAWALARHLTEPARGASLRREESQHPPRADVPRDRVLNEDPQRMPLWRAIRYVLRIRTNVILIAASAVGYFFFAGLRTFAVEFLRGRFSLSQAGATALVPLFGLGAIAGVIAGGRLADRLMAGGRRNARIDVPVVCFLIAALLFVPGLLIGSLAIAMTFYVLAAAALSAANPPLDSARLDIVPSRLWGRAESARTLVRELGQAGAPVLFGLTVDAVGGGHAGGVQKAFLIMLIPLALNGLIVRLGRRSYQDDVAIAAAAERT